jgi:hypothetical protein
MARVAVQGDTDHFLPFMTLLSCLQQVYGWADSRETPIHAALLHPVSIHRPRKWIIAA